MPSWSERSPLAVQTGLSIAAPSTGLTLPSGAKVRGALVQVFAAPIRYWVDGTAPTATTGHRADVYDQIELETFAEANNFRAIRESGVSATLEVTFYG